MVHANHRKFLLKEKILIHIMSEVEPKICISNKFSCDTAAALSSKGLETGAKFTVSPSEKSKM